MTEVFTISPSLKYSNNDKLECAVNFTLGVLGGVKVSCISRHSGIQLILAYSCTQPVMFVDGKGRGGNVFNSSVSSLSRHREFPCSLLMLLIA